jgi:hypothetical protein
MIPLETLALTVLMGGAVLFIIKLVLGGKSK